MNDLDPLNYFSLDILDKLGNHKPTQSQIELMELLVSGITLKQQIEINKLFSSEKNCISFFEDAL